MKYLISALITFFAYSLFAQDCPSGNVVFSSQSEIDQFLIDFPNCTAIDGNLYVTDAADITNLNGFMNLTVVEQNMLIRLQIKI